MGYTPVILLASQPFLMSFPSEVRVHTSKLASLCNRVCYYSGLHPTEITNVFIYSYFFFVMLQIRISRCLCVMTPSVNHRVLHNLSCFETYESASSLWMTSSLRIYCRCINVAKPIDFAKKVNIMIISNLGYLHKICWLEFERQKFCRFFYAYSLKKKSVCEIVSVLMDAGPVQLFCTSRIPDRLPHRIYDRGPPTSAKISIFIRYFFIKYANFILLKPNCLQ